MKKLTIILMASMLFAACGGGNDNKTAAAPDPYDASKKTENGNMISECIKKGELVPDDLIMSIIENRIKQTDC